MSFFDFIVPHYKDKYLNSILVSLLFNSKFNSLLSNNINNSSDNLFQKFIKELLNKKNIYNKISSSKLLSTLKPISDKRNKWINEYITKVYDLLNINYINIIYDFANNKYIINNTLDSISTNPDIIILFHSKLNKNSHLFINKYKELYKKDTNSATKFDASSYNLNFSGIDTYENEIILNDTIYKLENCLIANNTATIGFIYNNDYYIYNYWNLPYPSKCSIVKFNWNLKNTEKKCFNKSICNLFTPYNCINFNDNNNKILIYIKKDFNTKSPTKMPIKSPTKMPIKSPTKMPTKSPTKMPIKSPTKMPIKSPTKMPTKSSIKSIRKSLSKKEDKDYIIKILLSKLKKNAL